MGTRGREAARARKSAASSVGTLRDTGSLSPPWGAIRSGCGMHSSPWFSREPRRARGSRSPGLAAKQFSDLIRQGTGRLGAAKELGEGERFEQLLFLGLNLPPDRLQSGRRGRVVGFPEGGAGG